MTLIEKLIFSFQLKFDVDDILNFVAVKHFIKLLKLNETPESCPIV